MTWALLGPIMAKGWGHPNYHSDSKLLHYHQHPHLHSVALWGDPFFLRNHSQL